VPRPKALLGARVEALATLALGLEIDEEVAVGGWRLGEEPVVREAEIFLKVLV